MAKKSVLIFCCILIAGSLSAQLLETIDLKNAYKLLEARYPSLQNSNYFNAIYENEIQQIDKSKMPGLFLKADGRLQSHSTKLDVADGAMLPFEIDIPLYSLRSYVEAQYLIKDGGIREIRKKLKEVELGVNQQSIEVERFSLRTRVNHHFLNILVLREQSKIYDISLADLAERNEIIAAGVEYGTILETELSKLEVKKLELEAQKDNVQFKIAALINSLEQLLDVELADNVQLIFPQLSSPAILPEIQRPETKMFSLQREAILAQSDLIEAGLKPQLSAFAQAGLGYPNPLNIFDKDVAPYGLLGASFVWRLTDWKKNELEKERLALQAKQVELAEETFEFNLESQEQSYLGNVERLQKQIEYERDIADLQGEILKQIAVQLDEGVISTVDYISQLNAELLARQKLLVRQSELLKIQLEFWNERGAF